MSKKNVNELIDSVVTPSESQKDKLEIDRAKSLNILHFINLQLEKATAKQSLKQKTINKITEMMDDNDPEASFIALLKLLEILEKSDNDMTLGLLSFIKDQQDGLNPDDPSKSSSLDISDKDMDKIKKVVSLLDKLEKTEGK